MTEYQIVYTINGEGYTKDLPWIFAETREPKMISVLLDDVIKYLNIHSKSYEVWVVSREVTEWTRVDPETLT